MPLSGETLPKQHKKEDATQNVPETGEISPNQPPEQGDLEAMEKGVVGNTPTGREQVPTHCTTMGGTI